MKLEQLVTCLYKQSHGYELQSRCGRTETKTQDDEYFKCVSFPISISRTCESHGSPIRKVGGEWIQSDICEHRVQPQESGGFHGGSIR